VSKEGSSPFRSLAILLAANALPIGGLVWFLVARSRGEAKLAALPPGSMERLGILGAALVGIVFLAWGVYPAMAFATERLRAARRARREALANAGFAGKVVHGSVLGVQNALAAFLYVDLLILALTLVGLAAAEAWLLIDIGLSFSAKH